MKLQTLFVSALLSLGPVAAVATTTDSGEAPETLISRATEDSGAPRIMARGWDQRRMCRRNNWSCEVPNAKEGQAKFDPHMCVQCDTRTTWHCNHKTKRCVADDPSS